MKHKKLPRIRKLKQRAQDVRDKAVEVKDRVMPEDPGLNEKPPRITTENLSAHREEVLGSARKYIYPLKHSRHSIVKISATIFVAALVGFLVYCILALYKLQSESGFIYDVTRVVPFPIAKAGPDYVAYENYLFELRHYVHYYQTQQKIDLSSLSGKQQLVSFKKQALQQVIDNAFVKQLAAKYHVSVSDQELNAQISLLKSQNRLGSSDQVLADVLKQFWGWSIDDFKREVKQQLLAQKVVSTLDTATHTRAQGALIQLQEGADFATVAGLSQDSATKGNGGQYGFPIDQSNRDVPPQVVDALFKLQKPGDYSGIINTGSTLEIVKLLQINGNQRTAAHISFNFQPLSTYLDPLKAKEKTHRYVGL